MNIYLKDILIRLFFVICCAIIGLIGIALQLPWTIFGIIFNTISCIINWILFGIYEPIRDVSLVNDPYLFWWWELLDIIYDKLNINKNIYNA